MEEADEDGGVVVVVGGAGGAMDWVKPGSSWVGGWPVYGGLSNSPPNSMSWLLMSCSMSEGREIRTTITAADKVETFAKITLQIYKASV